MKYCGKTNFLLFGYRYWINLWDLILPIMACLLFINGVTNKGKFLKIDIGILYYLTTLPSKLFPPKLEHGQFQALQ